MDAPTILRDADLEYANSYRLASRCEELLLPQCEKDVVEIFERNEGRTFPILGHGNNVILAQSHYPRIMKIGRRFNSLTRLDEHFLYVDGGSSLHRVALACEGFGLAGFEYLGNIPGSVGGAIVMNAGAFGQDISSVIHAVRVYSIRERRVKELGHAECGWAYRMSIFQGETYVVLGAYFRLRGADPQNLRMQRLSNLAVRRERFPRSEPNAGSVFKRPKNGLKIGEMIEQLGYKGHSIGTACISANHAGFIVVKRPGSADDIRSLIAFMQREIKKNASFEF